MAIQAIKNNVTSHLSALPQKISDWTHAGKTYLVENKKALLVAALVASVATIIAGFAVMATASRIFSSTDIIACTMQSCSFITHYTIDSTFLKGFMTSLSGLVASIAVRTLLSELPKENPPIEAAPLPAPRFRSRLNAHRPVGSDSEDGAFHNVGAKARAHFPARSDVEEGSSQPTPNYASRDIPMRNFKGRPGVPSPGPYGIARDGIPGAASADEWN